MKDLIAAEGDEIGSTERPMNLWVYLRWPGVEKICQIENRSFNKIII